MHVLLCRPACSSCLVSSRILSSLKLNRPSQLWQTWQVQAFSLTAPADMRYDPACLQQKSSMPSCWTSCSSHEHVALAHGMCVLQHSKQQSDCTPHVLYSALSVGLLIWNAFAPVARCMQTSTLAYNARTAQATQSCSCNGCTDDGCLRGLVICNYSEQRPPLHCVCRRCMQLLCTSSQNPFVGCRRGILRPSTGRSPAPTADSSNRGIRPVRAMGRSPALSSLDSSMQTQLAAQKASIAKHATAVADLACSWCWEPST